MRLTARLLAAAAAVAVIWPAVRGTRPGLRVRLALAVLRGETVIYRAKVRGTLVVPRTARAWVIDSHVDPRGQPTARPVDPAR